MGDLAGEAGRQPEPCTDDTGQHHYEGSYATVAVSSLLSSRSGRRLARSAWTVEDVLAVGDLQPRSSSRTLSTSSSARLDR